MAKILLTGGAGFIGSHIADLYIANGYEVVIVDNLSSGKKENINAKAGFYKMDIGDPALLEIFAKEKPDFVNHHAAQINVRASIDNPLFDARVNIEGMLNVLENCRKHKVQKVIFASSGGAIYGDAAAIPTNENYPAWPISPYGVAKLAGEYYLNYYYKVYHLPYVALRYSNVYGPRQDNKGEAGVVAIFTEQMMKEAEPLINGDGEQTRDYVFVSDVAAANLLAWQSPGIGTYNIGTGRETSVNALFDQLQNLTGWRGEKRHGPGISGEVLRSCLETTLAKKSLGWEARVKLSEGLGQVVEWWKRNVKG